MPWHMADARALLLVLLLGGMASGCAFTVGRLALVTTRAGDLGAPRASAPRRAAGRDCVPIVVVAPIRMPDLARAVDRALAAGDGVVLTDAVVRYALVYVPPIGGRGCYVVEGDVS
jgi:hypothetical protein